DLAGHRIEARLLDEHGVVFERLPPPRLEDRHQPVAMKRLEDEDTAGPEHAQELPQYLPVGILAAIADRAEEVEHGIEARVRRRELAKIGLHPTRPLRRPGATAPFLELDG